MVLLTNVSDTDIYIGDSSGVTTSNGALVRANGGQIGWDKGPGRAAVSDTIYAIHGGSGNKSLNYWVMG
jgi:hypothetical protein